MRGVADLLAAGVSGTYVAPSDVFAAYLQAGDKDLAARGSFRDSAADDADAVVGDVPTHDGGVQVDGTGVVEDPSPADEQVFPLTVEEFRVRVPPRPIAAGVLSVVPSRTPLRVIGCGPNRAGAAGDARPDQGQILLELSARIARYPHALLQAVGLKTVA
jgi:hypothetical protein